MATRLVSAAPATCSALYTALCCRYIRVEASYSRWQRGNLLKWKQEFHFNVVCQTARTVRTVRNRDSYRRERDEREASACRPVCRYTHGSSLARPAIFTRSLSSGGALRGSRHVRRCQPHRALEQAAQPYNHFSVVFVFSSARRSRVRSSRYPLSRTVLSLHADK